MRFATILLCVALVLGTTVAPASARSKSRTGPYEGLASWLDIYDRKPWRQPKAMVARLRSKGVRTLYLQTSNYQRHRDIVFRDETGGFLEAAHAVDMKVVAWYFPSFQELQVDLRRSMKAIRYVSPKGHSFDSFAMDIEADNVWEDLEAERTPPVVVERDPLRVPRGPGHRHRARPRADRVAGAGRDGGPGSSPAPSATPAP